MGMRNKGPEHGEKKIRQADRTTKKRIVLGLGELFCGPGGLALGAIRSRLTCRSAEYRIAHVWANDYDEDSCMTYRRNISPKKPESVICGDVRDLKLDELEPIDIFAYGFPCNDFSVVGERKGFNGTFGPLYTYGVSVLERFKPQVFVAENVSGITSANDGKAFKRIIDDLSFAGDGYEVTINLYKFEDYGIPQSRHRIIIVGINKNLGKRYRVPAPTTLQTRVTARQAIECPPIPIHAANNERTIQSEKVIERLRRTRPGENAWTADLPSELQLNVKNSRLSHIYKRIDPNKPSYTITGSGGGGTHGYHWEEPRALTNRERARLQTFPDKFVFDGKKESVRKQIGMAVSPRMAEIVFVSILKTLAGVAYPSVASNWGLNPSLFDETSGKGSR